MVWLSLSHLLGTIMSKLLLSVVFACVVTPMGMCRRILGKDPLRLRQFKIGTGSVMVTRNHQFVDVDIEKPF